MSLICKIENPFSACGRFGNGISTRLTRARRRAAANPTTVVNMVSPTTSTAEAAATLIRSLRGSVYFLRDR